MKDMDLVYAIYQYGSFSKAAEELYIGQSSLSMAIQRIENELGMPLFDRRRHPIGLTEAGQEYIRYYRQVKPAQENMLARIRDLKELRTGRLTLGGSNYLLSYILKDCICAFARAYPGVDLQIVEAQSGAFRGLLADCKIDLCLKCDADDPGLQSIGHAFFDQLFLAVPRSLVADAPGSPLTAEDIRAGRFAAYEHYFPSERMEGLPFLQLTPGNNLHDRGAMILQQMDAHPAKIFQVQQLVTACQLAEAGLGCTLISSCLAQALNTRNLLFYTLPSSLMTRDFHFVTRKDAYITKAIQAFCALFAQQAG